MMEAAVILSLDWEPIFWHAPPNRSAVALPDSQSLWEIIWEHRKNVLGVAHSHPGSGVPSPSYEDVTTFAAIESAIGKRLRWPILNVSRIIDARWVGPGKLDYDEYLWAEEDVPGWAIHLRKISGFIE